MTDEAKEQIGDQIKAWSFPIMLAVIGWFGTRLMGEIEGMKTSLSELQKTVIELKVENKKDVEYLRRDTNALQTDVQELKKSLE